MMEQFPFLEWSRQIENAKESLRGSLECLAYDVRDAADAPLLPPQIFCDAHDWSTALLLILEQMPPHLAAIVSDESETLSRLDAEADAMSY